MTCTRALVLLAAFALLLLATPLQAEARAAHRMGVSHPSRPSHTSVSSANDGPQFVNPTGVITVPANSTFTILRNHSVSGGGTTGFWGLVTQVGTNACNNWRGELTAGASSCSDGYLSLYGVSNVNIDGNSMTAQFLYSFRTGEGETESVLKFCEFRPWEACTPQSTGQQTLKVLISNSIAATEGQQSQQHRPVGGAVAPHSRLTRFAQRALERKHP